MKHGIELIQSALRAENLAGWLLYDFRGSNPIALELLGAGPDLHLTRRFFYWIPATGTPLRIQSAVEAALFAELPGELRLFSGWRDLEAILQRELPHGRPLAMEYSPRGALPGVSFVDGGTLEWLRALGLDPVSSAELVQRVEAPWDESARALHRRAAALVEELRREAVHSLRRALAEDRALLDTDLQEQLLAGMAAAGLVTRFPPIAAFGPDSGNPHHSPDPRRPRRLAPGQVVLLDIWAKVDAPGAVYADFTWVCFAGKHLPEPVAAVWRAVREARDSVIARLRERLARGEPPRGYEGDRVARDCIARHGFGERFVHRTGHSIGTETHGPGANLDDLESRDERPLVDGVAFSIEPGIYLDDFGIRSEVNALRIGNELEISGELQEEPERLL